MPMGENASSQIKILADTQALVEAAAEYFVTVAAQATAATGRCVIALSGGSTPKSLYALLATPTWAKRVDWSRLHLCWGDERCVPPEDAASNYHMTREALLDHVPVPSQNIHRIHGEIEPVAAASMYESELRGLFGTPEGPPLLKPDTRFDLVLLGMGANGHTASLFPGLAAVQETGRWVMAEYVAEVSMWRVTLTPPVLNAAADVIFLVSGADKASMLARVVAAPRQPDVLPAQAIAPAAGTLRWLVDTTAAADLTSEE